MHSNARHVSRQQGRPTAPTIAQTTKQHVIDHMIATPSPFPYLLHLTLLLFSHVLEEGIGSQSFTFTPVIYHISLCIISALFGMPADAGKRLSNKVCDQCRRQKVGHCDHSPDC